VELFQGTHTIEVNGTRRTIRIRQCLVTIETGVFILHLQNGEKIRIIDPGAKTTDLVTLFMGQYVDDESTTINQGWETKGGGRKGVEPFARLIVGEAGDLDWDESDPIIYVIGGRAGDIVEPIKEEGFSHAKLPDDLPMARDLNGKEFQLDASWVNAYCYLLAIKGALGIAS
jgi:plasmid segregation protein ParM